MEVFFNYFLITMVILAIICFIALFFIEAGYGRFTTNSWGWSIKNTLGWFLMEAPVFIFMLVLWLVSDRKDNISIFIIFACFQLHYFHRAFIFPLLIKGKSRMPLAIIAMGIVFNSLNALMQGGWLFYISNEQQYNLAWLQTPQFIIGALVFFTGLVINLDSDRRIRNLRKPGDTKHYFPRGGMFKHITSANYFGEFIEWCGFAIMTWSTAGVVFALWTFANLAPRANAIYNNYKSEFPKEFTQNKLKRIIPFIY